MKFALINLLLVLFITSSIGAEEVQDTPKADDLSDFFTNSDLQLLNAEDKAFIGLLRSRKPLIFRKVDTDKNNRLSELEIEVARNLLREQAVERSLRQYDTNRDGVLNDGEREAAKEHFVQQAARLGEQLRKRDPGLFAELDGDKDGIISPAEAKRARELMTSHHHKESASRLRTVKGARAEMDKNGDGKISDEERIAVEQQFWSKVKEENAEIFAEIDSDGDGKISKEERRKAGKILRETGDTSSGMHSGAFESRRNTRE